MNFSTLTNKTILKPGQTVSALTGLIPNINCPRTSKRKILSEVVTHKSYIGHEHGLIYQIIKRLCSNWVTYKEY